VKYPTFFGVDLTSAEAKPSACLELDSRSQLVHFGFLTKNRDMTALLGLYSPQVIAIDAPLSLPLGLCCLDEGCPCHPKSFRRNRQCDRELRRQGIPRYPTIKKTFIKDLIYRGIELKTSISREVKQAGKVIEVYPLASKVRLFGTTIPRKTTRQGMGFLREKLGDILPALRPYLDMFDHDLADIAVAAYTALLYHQNGAEALGR
jgi:predicted nuclease with RNAse H fold